MVFSTRKCVGIYDSLNRSGFEVDCYRGVEKDCQYLKVAEHQCKKDGKPLQVAGVQNQNSIKEVVNEKANRSSTEETV